jgi:hypothetical protein
MGKKKVKATAPERGPRRSRRFAAETLRGSDIFMPAFANPMEAA